MQSKNSYLDQYKIIRTLGFGSYSKVKLAEAPNQTLVAIKRFNWKSNLDTLTKQIKVISKLHHQNLVNFIDMRQNATYRKKNGKTYSCMAIILEYAAAGQFFDFIAESGYFSPIVARTYLIQLLNGLEYMHKQGYAHRDLKPQNILLNSDFILKIADFGFSTQLVGKDKTGVLHTRLGTEGYQAPEIRTQNYKGEEVDIFASGVILFMMCTAAQPFNKTFPPDPSFKMIKQKRYKEFWQWLSDKRPNLAFSDNLKDLIQRMLAYKPNQRIKIEEIRNHPWIKNQNVLSQQQLKSEFNSRKKKVDAQLQKKRIKQKQKQISIFGIFKFTRGEDTIDDFCQSYKQYQYIQLPTKKDKLNKYDLEIIQSVGYSFATLIAFFKDPIQLSNQVSFEAKYTIDQNIFNVCFTSSQEQTQVRVKIQLFTLTEQRICLTMNYEQGDVLYFRLLFSKIKQEFLESI